MWTFNSEQILILQYRLCLRDGAVFPSLKKIHISKWLEFSLDCISSLSIFYIKCIFNTAQCHMSGDIAMKDFLIIVQIFICRERRISINSASHFPSISQRKTQKEEKVKEKKIECKLWYTLNYCNVFLRENLIFWLVFICLFIYFFYIVKLLLKSWLDNLFILNQMWRTARCFPVSRRTYLWSQKPKPSLARDRAYASLKAFRVTVIYSLWTDRGWSFKACSTRFMVITNMECKSRLEQQLASLSLCHA